MRIDKDLIRYLTTQDIRVLIAVEQGMRNHQIVPVPLIQSIAALKRTDTYSVIKKLLKYKFIHHDASKYDGYNLTRQGYDILALSTFLKRGLLTELGSMIGIGKQSDIYICRGPLHPPTKQEEKKEEQEQAATDASEGGPRPMRTLVLKLARLGRTSFRAVKQKRDYLKNRSTSSWLYLSRLAAMKQFGFMKILHARGFPVPEPVDWNRHAVLMEHIDAAPMRNISEMVHPKRVFQRLMELIIKLGEHGLVHGDFNEYNLLINEAEKVTLIDFPQMVSVKHPHAQEFFDRDVKSIKLYFKNKMGIVFDQTPQLTSDVEQHTDLDVEMKASGFQISQEAETMLQGAIAQQKQDLESGNIDSEGEAAKEESDEQDQEPSSGQEADQQEQKLIGQQETTETAESTEQTEAVSESNPEAQAEEEASQPKGKRTVKMINPEWARERVRQQLRREGIKKKQHRNKNKDKKIMKQKAEMREQLE